MAKTRHWTAEQKNRLLTKLSRRSRYRTSDFSPSMAKGYFIVVLFLCVSGGNMDIAGLLRKEIDQANGLNLMPFTFE
jgi:hypothetical protein